MGSTPINVTKITALLTSMDNCNHSLRVADCGDSFFLQAYKEENMFLFKSTEQVAFIQDDEIINFGELYRRVNDWCTSKHLTPVSTEEILAYTIAYPANTLFVIVAPH